MEFFEGAKECIQSKIFTTSLSSHLCSFVLSSIRHFCRKATLLENSTSTGLLGWPGMGWALRMCWLWLQKLNLSALGLPSQSKSIHMSDLSSPWQCALKLAMVLALCQTGVFMGKELKILHPAFCFNS